MNRILFLATLLLLQACSDNDNHLTITKEQCASLGGELVNGRCEQEVSPDFMRKYCQDIGKKYIAELNACLEE